MNIAFLPDLSALAILIIILAMVRRRHSDARANAWLLGLFFMMVEATAHTMYAPHGVPNRILHLIVLDCYLLAGLVFNWAAGNQSLSQSSRLLYISLNGATLLWFISVYGWNIRVPQPYILPLLIGAIVGVVSSFSIRHNWHYALGFLGGWSVMGLLVSQGKFRDAVYWSLACVYAIAAYNFQRRLARKSTGKLAIVTGFSIWACCFLIHPWVISHYPQYADVASHVWNMQKSLISIGMILVMLEEQVSNNEWLALHDELTGLPNRRLFAARLTTAIEYTNRRKCNLALVVLDINDFKKINDTMGHVAGDQVLREVSAILRKSIRSTDTVARLGGDEFIIVATDMPDELAIDRFTDSLRTALDRKMTINDEPLTIGVSVGHAMYPRDASDATKLLRLADQRMYGLKRRPMQTAKLAAQISTAMQA